MAGYIGKSQGKILTNVEGNSVETADIQDSAVTETKIAAGSVTDSKLNSTKLDGIEAGATADQTGAEIKAAYEGEANTNAYTDAEKTKLSGIEAGADVTDTANVTAAGALMDSEVTNLAQVKAFSSADYATAAQGAKADSALQNITGESIEDLSDVATMTPSDGQLLTWNSTTSKWNAEDAPVSLPSQTGNSGYYLTTNGTSASWDALATVANSGAYSDLSGTPTTVSTFTNDSGYITGNQTITLSGDVSGSGTTSISVTVADDSHNHVISNVDGLQTALDGKSSTSHNHTLDGLSNTTITTNTAGEILKWNGTAWVNNTLAEAGIQPSGSYLTGNQTITLSGDVSGSGTTAINVTVADDSHNHIISNVDGLQTALDGKLSTSGKAADSNLLDGIDSGSFLRSDAADTKTSGDLTFNDNIKASFGTSADLQIYHDGSNSIINEQGTGNLFLRGSAAIRLQRYDGTENFLTCDQDAAVTLFYNGASKLATTSTGVSVTGTVAATSFTGDGSALTGIASTVASGCIYENSQTITSNYTMTTNKNGHSAGPITINTGVTVTIPTGSNWVVS